MKNAFDYIVLSCQFLKKENMNPAKEFNFLQCYVAALAGLYIINHTFCSVVLRSQIKRNERVVLELAFMSS